ncbi:hypothetical protein [Chryseobacterium sp. Bi04]|uniref:DUF3108 domain-containing protein n=1 Tax=Chryseobacterium sp. Bi04 TaxID=2822345 RepID=UPI001E0EFC59|nr:hypothetical protein [Chryseobacterium sp. Bi04]CAH0242275.1 hypothetical protein SRABI04_03009 [Chryseobacterium sp. Bi04]
MKTFLILLLISSTHLFSQKLLTPSNSGIDPQLIQDETSEAVWYAENAGKKIEIGNITTQIKKLNATDLLIMTTVKMKQTPNTHWVDSTLVKTANLQPIRHSSFNMNRDMVFTYHKNKVTGYYLDKKTQKKDDIDMPASHYFDSSTYPTLIRFLPLKEKYTAEISIFDYNPNATKKGIMKAYIQSVEKGDYQHKKVWIVKTADDITEKTTTVTYYIDSETRKILKQDIESGTRKMSIETIQ